MRKVGLFIFLTLSFLTLPALADQVPFGPLVGRTSQVVTERRQFGDILTFISLNVRISDEARVTDMNVESLSGGNNISTLNIYSPAPSTHDLVSQVTARCEGPGNSQDANCIGVRAINSCNFNSLSTQSKTALNFLLGSCLKSCITATQTLPWGETTTQYQWSCSNPMQAQCVMIAGMEGRIDLIYHASDCQF